MENSSPTIPHRQELLAEQVALLYGQGPVGLFGTTLAAAFYTYITWDILPKGLLAGWFCLILVISGARIVLEYQYKKTGPETGQAKRWGMFFNIGTFLSGIAWGLAALLLFPEQSFAHQIFLAFLVGGLSIGTIATYTSLKWTSALFSTPPMLILIGKFLSLGGEINYAIGIILGVFLLMMISTSLRVHSTTLSSLDLRFSNLELLNRVGTEKEWFKRLSEATFEGILVHDQEVQRDLIKTEILKKMDAELLEASNGLEALEILKGTSPDLLITDIEMPEMDGFELIREVRNDAELGDLPILVASSLFAAGVAEDDSREDIGAKVLELGANGYSQKPLIAEEFIEKIGLLINGP